MDDTPLPPTRRTSSAADLQSAFRREGEYWTIAYADATCRLRDSAGLRHLSYLLARPGERVAAIELVEGAALSAPGGAEAPPSIGQRTADPLAHERARVRVTHAIRHTLRRIAAHHPELNEHLRATIKTGTMCGYLPDPRKPVCWELG